MLGKISSFFHWLGKYSESNEISQLAQILSHCNIKTSKELVLKLLKSKELEQILDLAANEDESGCYQVIQKWYEKET